MGGVREVLEGLKARGGKALIPYLVAGYPSLDESMELLLALQDRGAAAVEVGIPFSDPMADGPTIQKAHSLALEGGVTPEALLKALEFLKGDLTLSIILMTYYNPVFRMGEEVFAQRAREAGVAGVIIPDLPPEEGQNWVSVALEVNLDTVFLAAPNTPLERVETIASVTTGFLYYLALKGVTGSAIKDAQEVAQRVARIRDVVDIPVCVGFGISTALEAALLARGCDGVIVGSALLKALDEGGMKGFLGLFGELMGALEEGKGNKWGKTA